MGDHRTGAGTGAALKTFKNILPADLSDFFQKLGIYGSIIDVKGHRLLQACLYFFKAGFPPEFFQAIAAYPE